MAVNIDGDGLIALGGTSSTQGRLRLAEDTDNGTNYIELTAPASVGSDRVITFPDATTTVVGTDTTQTLTNKSIVATQLTGTIAAARLPAGSVLQVVTTNFPTVVSQAGTAGTWFDISGFSASITPSSASNKILVLVSIGRVAETNGVHTSAFRVLRGATAVGVGSGMTGSQVAASFTMTIWASDSQQGGGTANSFVDSPNTTSSTTYQVQWMVQGTRTWVLNRTQNNVNTNDSYGAYTLSTITLMEIAA